MGCSGTKQPKLSIELEKKVNELYDKMNGSGGGALTREKAKAFFNSKFGGISADAMFNEVDVDDSGDITKEEFFNFWLQVKKHKYTEEDIMEEIDGMIKGQAWVDWKDDQSTAKEVMPKGK
eukprot:NODE_24839_length_608_cov_5.528067.p3 GENE.NODE_24839_length_608_cov_5.528067~~NODE_24839_length_608_cov_5.528067.p3  ORF type:complete len:121 (+),score=38.88 NODE_24839_length_608_cov_5.528067:78-440(+)